MALRALRCPARASHRQARAPATQTSTHRARKAHTLTLTHTHSAPTFAPHTKGRTTIPMGRARSARPIGTVVGAREARAPFVCGANVAALLCVCFPSSVSVCVCFPSSVSARLCGARVLDDVRTAGRAAHPRSPQPSLALQLRNQPWAHYNISWK